MSLYAYCHLRNMQLLSLISFFPVLNTSYCSTFFTFCSSTLFFVIETHFILISVLFIYLSFSGTLFFKFSLQSFHLFTDIYCHLLSWFHVELGHWRVKTLFPWLKCFRCKVSLCELRRPQTSVVFFLYYSLCVSLLFKFWKLIRLVDLFRLLALGLASFL